jgi:pimeloyl-ACP methyl ester carboxylesterase
MKTMKRVFFALAVLFFANTAFSQTAIYVDKVGKGNPILFLPGFTTPGSVWDETIKNLKGNYESYKVSYAGFNGLEPIGTPWYEPVRNQLINYIEKEKLSNLIIIGHSMGGMLAIDIAAELSDQVKGLILVEAIPCMLELIMPGVPASSIQYNSPYNKQMLDMPDEDFKKMAMSSSQGMTIDQSKIETITNWILDCDKKTYVYGYTDLLKLDLRDKLSTISARTLIIGAELPNKAVILSTFDKQYVNLKSKTILIAENSRHFIMFDQPEWFYESVNLFLKVNDK